MGFRYTVQNIAQQFDVRGYVRNLPDGRVELVMEGADSDMDQLLSAVHQKMQCYISEVQSTSAPATHEFARFLIRH